ncbi:Interferon-related protein conserved region [Nesidiocoris tenuis]|uniref:Interferon-related protein conserved region n=1 Tax=Nesidiocoris tenuis TaxID=355587 RepID=A0ABN7A7D2_9HEMI|nr:Interferon-related protein conserved region [Nesidiocoris tenuis]
MPKGNKKKGKSTGKGRVEFVTSDEDSLNDNASVISLASDGTFLEEGNEENDENVQNDAFEEKLIEAIDGLTQKSAQGRTHCLEAISTSFTMRFIPEFVINRKLTLTDGIERCLKKGRGLEQAAAAQLATLLCVQLGSGDMTDQVCRDISPILTFIVNDASMSVQARSKCCWALGLLSFLANVDDIGEPMTTLEGVFSTSYHKGDGTVPSVSVELASLHYAALSSWSLLLTITDLSFLNSYNLPSISQLAELLDSAHLDIRMAAGECIALLLEQGRELSDDWLDEVTDELLDKLRQLATDSQKFRAKKDRKTQRSSFRDILRFVENDELPNIQVRFGQESLSLDSWSKKKQYDTFCQVLGSGMNLHLSENYLLRDILDLGEKISPLNSPTSKQSKLARTLLNAANFKARSISRAKNRDKRSAVVP